MSRFLAITRIVGLILFLGSSLIGYRFFRVWQKNERPIASKVSWEPETVTLGKPTVLRATIRMPWHREISSPVPTRSPKALVASLTGGQYSRGRLNLSGHRTWTVSIPVVPGIPEKVEARVIEVPLKSTRRRSSNSVAIPLPKLEIVMPEEIPESVLVATEPIRPDAPLAEAPVIAETEKPPFPTALVVGLVLGAALLFFLFRWLNRPTPAVPPWITAQHELDELSRNPPGEPSIFFLRLTDILKRYTAQRFDTPADAASSTELLATLGRVPEFRADLREPLTKVVRQADSVKFASARIESEACRYTLARVREFVGNTTPGEEETANA